MIPQNYDACRCDGYGNQECHPYGIKENDFPRDISLYVDNFLFCLFIRLCDLPFVRHILLLSFSQPMTSWLAVENGKAVEGVFGATPLAQIAAGETANLPSLMDMFLGTRGGCMGETCALALIIGGIYLIWRKVITITIPLSFIGGVFVLSLLFGVDPMYQVLGGGLMIGAFFMATDYTTSPITEKGKIIFGLGCALITMVIRVFGSYPEGVSYSILLMNIVTPHINRMVRNKAFGGVQQ